MGEFFYALVSILSDIVVESRRLAIAIAAGELLLVAFTFVVVRFVAPAIVVPILAGSVGAGVIAVTAWAWWRYLRAESTARPQQ